MISRRNITGKKKIHTVYFSFSTRLHRQVQVFAFFVKLLLIRTFPDRQREL